MQEKVSDENLVGTVLEFSALKISSVGESEGEKKEGVSEVESFCTSELVSCNYCPSELVTKIQVVVSFHL